MRTRLLPLLLIAGLAACKPAPPPEPTMTEQTDILSKLAFTCAHEKERIPPRDAEAEQLYQYSRWLRHGNMIQREPAVYAQTERYVRLAAAYGHDLASYALALMLTQGQAYSRNTADEAVSIAEDMKQRGIPMGYYLLALFLDKGYGVTKNREHALQYYRKAADLGNPEAQFWVAERLAPISVAPAIGRQMRRCAAEQGHGKAGMVLGIDLKNEAEYPAALEAFQLGVKGGDPNAASFLRKGFNGPPADDRHAYLGQKKDPERMRRYEEIGHVLSMHDYLNPTVPELDKIVPLPPAKLPPWDGKLQWLEAHKKNIPPPLPSEARIVEMAQAKGLDPATGRPVAVKR